MDLSIGVWVWLAAAILFVVIEIFAPGFIFACFVIGSIAAGVTTVFTDSLLIQGAVFAVVSIGLIPVTRPLANKITKPSPIISNVDGFIGKIGIVKKEVSEVHGQILIEGQIWQARAENTFPIDAKVKVIKVEGAKFFVEEA
ncbi:MAG: NfeD family protein [candidate division Zixibacteria bacterium]|nr:NfeD family protein [candidate division Zixibacteria bacterium]